MGRTKTNEIDMLHGPVYGKMFVFIMPLILSSALQLLFNAADVIVVGRYAGAQALAAVGTTASIVNFVINIFLGLTAGVNYVVARSVAIGDDRRTSRAIHTGVTATTLLGIGAGLLIMLGARGILTLMGTPAEIKDLARTYLIVYMIGLPGLAFYDAGAAILRSVGDTKRPMYFLTAAGILNLLLNLFFVIVLKLSVLGVAAATTISNYLAGGLVALTLLRHEGALRLDMSKLGIDAKVLQETLGIGVPSAVQSSMFGITNMLTQSAVNSLGAITIAGYAAASNLEAFLYVVPGAVSTAELTFISQNFGARKYSRSGMILRAGMVLGFAMTLSFGLLWVALRYPLVGLYSTDPAVIAMGASRIAILAPAACMEVSMQGIAAAIRGMGHAKATMISSMIFICGFRVLWVMTVFRMFHTHLSLVLVWPISWTIISIFYIFLYRKIRSKYPYEDVVAA